MKERPILFSAPMVRALLDGSKTQTRRALKVQPWSVTTVESGRHIFDFRSDKADLEKILDMPAMLKRCPYGQPGDRLWVRENGWERPDLSLRDLREGADTWPRYEYDAAPLMCWAEGELKGYGWKRRPSIHMPRWASRITLEIVSVRIERLLAISEADAIAEGIERLSSGEWKDYGDPTDSCADPVSSYRSLWESINGFQSSKDNPWVWCISFRSLP